MMGCRIVIKTVDGQICSAILVGESTDYFTVKEVQEFRFDTDARVPNLNAPGELFSGEIRYYKKNIIYCYITK
ncbi:hypothetical protein [Desulforamulus aquiferis]|uniref:Uncharacterized protein n=1 Tax=Desulforamulus aquiferis TaxID=1397668 RepID=A0AAW7ZD16_9FIRM|nr:hypothetical protein [Desulforamulus aquiferis]MDO7787226.1 hypothetical protein [Desulforamulus aquiferis]RYD02703.1 hypothetical protein N752_23270 [Desulforamulus aquiferis]